MLNLAAYHNSPDHSTKGTISHVDVLYVLVSTGFQVLFHSPPGVLFTFPSRYYTLSVTWSYLALGDGPPCIPTGLLVSCGTLELCRIHFHFAYEAVTLFGQPFQIVQL